MNVTLPTPVFLRFAAGGGEPQKNRALNESVTGVANHQIHHPGKPDGVLPNGQDSSMKIVRATTNSAGSKLTLRVAEPIVVRPFQ